MEEQNKALKAWRLTAIIAICLLVITNLMHFAGTGSRGEEPAEPAETETAEKSAAEVLSLWQEDAPARKELISFMEAITDPGSP